MIWKMLIDKLSDRGLLLGLAVAGIVMVFTFMALTAGDHPNGSRAREALRRCEGVCAAMDGMAGRAGLVEVRAHVGTGSLSEPHDFECVCAVHMIEDFE